MRSFLRTAVVSATAWLGRRGTDNDETQNRPPVRTLCSIERGLQPRASRPSLLESLKADKNLSLFSRLLNATAPELLERLRDESGAVSTSLFVPNDVALRRAFNASVLPTHLADSDYELHLNNLINFHAAGETVLEALVLGGGYLSMLNNESILLSLTLDAGTGETGTLLTSTTTNQTLARISTTTLQVPASNGALQELDCVLLPAFVFRNLVAVARSIGHISIFLFLVVDAGWDKALAGGEYTVLAPTNTAISNVGPALVNSLSDKEFVSRFVASHIIPQVLPTIRISDSQVYRLESNESVTASVSSSGVVAFGNATVQLANQLANNGILHVVDGVLLMPISPASAAPSPAVAHPSEAPNSTASPRPTESTLPVSSPSPETSPEPSITPVESTVHPSESPVGDSPSETPTSRSTDQMDVANVVRDMPVYSSLAQMVSLVPEIERILSSNDDEGITAFGPTNDAIRRMGPVVLSRLSSRGFHEHLRNMLSYHVTTGSMSAFDLTNGTQLIMLNGEPIDVQQFQGIRLTSPRSRYQTLATVTDLNHNASNGYFHGVDGVLLPSFVYETVASLANSTPTLSSFSELAARAGLQVDLAGTDCTLLAPSDAAFRALDVNWTERLANVDILRSVLLGHVLLSVVPSSAFETKGTYQSANGGSVSVQPSGNGGGVLLNSARVVSGDLLAWNGLIHIIDRVMLPNETELAGDSTPSADPSSGDQFTVSSSRATCIWGPIFPISTFVIGASLVVAFMV